MTQRSISDRPDVFAGDVQAIVQQRANLSANDERLGAARTRSIADDISSSKRWAYGGSRMRGERDADRIILNRPRNRNGAHGFSHFENFALSENTIDLGFLTFVVRFRIV